MIPISHFVHVIQAERERELARWQRSHAADLSEQPGPATSLARRVGAALRSRGLIGELPANHTPSTERTNGVMACC